MTVAMGLAMLAARGFLRARRKSPALLAALCAVNFGATVVLCGPGEGHTAGYRRLGTRLPAG